MKKLDIDLAVAKIVRGCYVKSRDEFRIDDRTKDRLRRLIKGNTCDIDSLYDELN